MYFARIKKTSEYAHQDNGKPFPVQLNTDHLSYAMSGYIWKGGPGGRYRMRDLELYVKDHTGALVKVPR